MVKKCAGCGAIMQFDNVNTEGFIAEAKYENASFCERCFRIKNYGDYKSVVKDNTTFVNILKEIGKQDLVVLVMDLFNMPDNLDLIKENINSPILLVLTKRDILPKVLYEDKLLAYTDKYDVNFIDRIIVSSNKNYHFDDLIFKIKIHNRSNKVYFIGFTNAGKSSLINKLIYNYTEEKPVITTSMLPSTTLNTIEIKFNDNMTFIDTPGLISDGSIENIVDVKMLKRITPKEEIRPLTYQIRSKQFIIVENLLKLELANNNVTIFMANALKIDRYYKDKELPDLITQTLYVSNNEDIVISGLGFIKFTKKEKVQISVPENLKVYIRSSLV